MDPSTSAPLVLPRQARRAAIDHLRIGLTLLVIAHHVALVYGGAGGWYWREEANGSNPLLLLFNAINQSFFMGMFFLLAGYYTPPAYEKKGPRRFLRDRFLRLGVPLVGYFCFVSPLTTALADQVNGGTLLERGFALLMRGKIEPGPLWFAEALLFLAIAYVVFRGLFRRAQTQASVPSFGAMAVAALGLGVISFGVRLVVPVGENIFWLQLGYFPCYLFLFAAGCRASAGELLETLTWRHVRPWLFVSFLALLSLPVVVLGGLGSGRFEGGVSNRALYYALWDPFVGWGIISGLLWAAQTYASRSTALTNRLADHAYGCFCVHPPVIVGLSLWAADWEIKPLMKFMVVTPLACCGSYAVSALVRTLPGARRIL